MLGTISGWVRVRRGTGPGLSAEEQGKARITWQWPFIFADAFSNRNQHIQVGTGEAEADMQRHIPHRRCTRPEGSMQWLDPGYPELWKLSEGIERIIYQATFPAGSLGRGINEVCLCDGGDVSAYCLAYGRLRAAMPVGPADVVQIRWEIDIVPGGVKHERGYGSGNGMGTERAGARTGAGTV